MQGRKLGLTAFALGVVCMHLFLTVNFWLIVVGIQSSCMPGLKRHLFGSGSSQNPYARRRAE